MPKINDSHKKNLRTAIFFVLGVICTLAITSLWNKALPEEPIIVKEVSDSIKVVHEYKIPKIDDSLEITLKKKLENLELLNNYEKEIDNRIKRIENKSKNSAIPNLISLKFSESYESKGYTQGNANSFFKMECPNINSAEFIDFRFDFFNPKILDEIAFLRLNIYKFEKTSDKESRSYILNQFYEPYENNDNFIRIENNLKSGKYEIMIGFTLKKDLNKKYPDFYMKKCILTKK
ncbi:hypothetical protein SAMN05421824_0426 [Hyunsoonleella jejuensis]|uniref:Uncharacterized protein n=1 Tax=Hyunsoonleella jejuensis TaxID=419940 RepID=A0A1H9B2X7_9FLAO|nr:hypothetical protein [Hyunsoonleella jejuensis]SEP83041.1 hypothetical protein SAMN05421824_0426 [Hyunsoonleella jejuensis]